MIKITINRADYEYDIYSLVQAFFPGEELYLDYQISEEYEAELPYQVKQRRKLQNDAKEAEYVLDVKFADDSISVSFSENNTGRTFRDTCPFDPEDRPNTKNHLKKSIYKILAKSTDRLLPWGTLTGIRPTKIALTMLSEGKSEDDVRSYIKETYLASQEKIDLSVEIASREITLLSKLKTLVSAKRGIRDAHLGYSIYIGIPFCPTTCLYCSFPSYARASYTGKVQKYLDALKKEIREVSEIMKDRVLNTVYIGGGTPTALSAEELEELFSYLYEVLPMDSIAEFNVEAGRPDSITREKLEVMKKYNVSRISINPQTMNEKTLKLIGRHHSVESVRESFALAREMGFPNINMDLILGLPGETKEDVLYTFSEVEKMAPDSVTVHSLAVKTHSRLREQWEEYKGYVMENSSYLMQAANETAERLGLKPYYLYRQKQMVGNLENVGFAKPGLEGLYNILIMEEQQDIVALGAGTASKKVHMDGTTSRCENVKDVDTYIDRIDEMIERKRKLFS